MRRELDATRLIERLEGFAHTLPPLVECFSPDDIRWRPDAGSWSVLEIVCHLADEEVEDFRTRTLMTLQDPDAPWPPIDPQGWATQREYQSQDMGEQLDRFVQRRHESVSLLRALVSPDWTRTHTHPSFGDFSAGRLLANWCAHDALHMRQLSKRLYQLADRDSGGSSLDYAGTW